MHVCNVLRLACISFYFFFSLKDEAMKFLIEKILELPSESQQPSEHISLSMSVKKPQFDDSFEMDKETPKPKDQCCS